MTLTSCSCYLPVQDIEEATREDGEETILGSVVLNAITPTIISSHLLDAIARFTFTLSENSGGFGFR